MAFTSRRGRPRAISGVPDTGTPELKRKRASGLTVEPIDLCLEKGIIDEPQHRSGMHLRWLYTLRYGAPSLTTRYFLEEATSGATTCEQWRSAREQEYLLATRLLASRRLDQAILRLAVYNELPAFMSPALLQQAWVRPALAERLDSLRADVSDGLELLVRHWQRSTEAGTAHPPINR